MNPDQMEVYRESEGIRPGEEWEPEAGLDIAPERLRAIIEGSPFYRSPPRRRKAAPVALPDRLAAPVRARLSTQDAFGRILVEIAREGGPLADRIVTASPDVTVSTGLGGWVNRRGIFAREVVEDVFREENVVSAQRWWQGPTGQHVELGIAENNLFLCLAALGLSAELTGERLFPVGTLYDPFIAPRSGRPQLRCLSGCALHGRGDAVGHYAGSGRRCAPVRHHAEHRPRPAGPDGVRAGLTQTNSQRSCIGPSANMQEEDGGAVYLRLSTRPLDQPERELDIAAVISGAYWLEPPEDGVEFAIVSMGAVLPEALAALAAVREDMPGAGLLAVTSIDRLHGDWLARGDDSRAARLLAPVSRRGGLVTILDGHPSALGWLGSVAGHRVEALGTTSFGQSGDIPDLYRAHRLDTDAILDASARLCLRS